ESIDVGKRAISPNQAVYGGDGAAVDAVLLQTNEEHRVRLGRNGCGRHDRQSCRCCHTQSSGARQHVPLSFGFHDCVSPLYRPPQPQLAFATGFNPSTENATRILGQPLARLITWLHQVTFASGTNSPKGIRAWKCFSTRVSPAGTLIANASPAA